MLPAATSSSLAPWTCALHTWRSTAVAQHGGGEVQWHAIAEGCVGGGVRGRSKGWFAACGKGSELPLNYKGKIRLQRGEWGGSAGGRVGG